MNMAQKLRSQLGVPVEQKHFKIHYGHDGQKMFIAFGGEKVDNLTMNVAQCDEMIKALQGLRGAFIKHQKENGNG